MGCGCLAWPFQAIYLIAYLITELFLGWLVRATVADTEEQARILENTATVVFVLLVIAIIAFIVMDNIE